MLSRTQGLIMSQANSNPRRAGEAGFTLVELLVVLVVLALLAAIALPAFFSQKDKAHDADAKASVRTAETAIEAYATESDAKYDGATAGDLERIEPTLTDAPNPDGLAHPVIVDVPATINVLAGVDENDNSYTVSVKSDTGTMFSITRHGDGTSDLTCDDAGKAGCPGSGAGPGSWG